jgi:hypothetical protein
MQRVYSDFSLHYSKRDFDSPNKPLNVDLECGDENAPAPVKGGKKKQVIDTDEF